jgi:hypothetical protein
LFLHRRVAAYGYRPTMPFYECDSIRVQLMQTELAQFIILQSAASIMRLKELMKELDEPLDLKNIAYDCEFPMYNSPTLRVNNTQKVQLMTETKAREILDNIIQSDNSLYDLGGYIEWTPGDKLIIDNDGDYLELTPTFLRALAWWIENHND